MTNSELKEHVAAIGKYCYNEMTNRDKINALSNIELAGFWVAMERTVHSVFTGVKVAEIKVVHLV